MTQKCEMSHHRFATFVIVDKKLSAEHPTNYMPKKKVVPPSSVIIQSRYLTLARFDYSAAEKTIMSHLVKMMQVLLDGQRLDGSLFEKVRHEDFFQKGLKITCNLKDLGATRQNWNDIRYALEKLNERKFEIDNEKKWKIIRLIEMPELEKGSGEVSFVLHKELVQAFLSFSGPGHQMGFSRFSLETTLSLSSIYARRLYEMVANGKPFYMTIKHLKEIFKIENKYQQNRDFILYCIDYPKKELDDKSHWSFDYEVTKSGRRYEGIRFTPVHNLRNDPEAMKQREIARKDRALIFIDIETRNYLLHNGWTKKEILNNRQLFSNACKIIGKNFAKWCQERWNKSQDLEQHGKVMNSKGWFIGILKRTIEEDMTNQSRLEV